jgi:hypothetical protein
MRDLKAEAALLALVAALSNKLKNSSSLGTNIDRIDRLHTQLRVKQSYPLFLLFQMLLLPRDTNQRDCKHAVKGKDFFHGSGDLACGLYS